MLPNTIAVPHLNSLPIALLIRGYFQGCFCKSFYKFQKSNTTIFTPQSLLYIPLNSPPQVLQIQHIKRIPTTTAFFIRINLYITAFLTQINQPQNLIPYPTTTPKQLNKVQLKSILFKGLPSSRYIGHTCILLDCTACSVCGTYHLTFTAETNQPPELFYPVQKTTFYVFSVIKILHLHNTVFAINATVCSIASDVCTYLYNSLCVVRLHRHLPAQSP